MEYVCKRCVKSGKYSADELEKDRMWEATCSKCGVRTWCWLLSESREREVPESITVKSVDTGEDVVIPKEFAEEVGVMSTPEPMPIKVTMDASEALDTLEEIENITKTIDEQIAELERRKAELEK